MQQADRAYIHAYTHAPYIQYAGIHTGKHTIIHTQYGYKHTHTYRNAGRHTCKGAENNIYKDTYTHTQT